MNMNCPKCGTALKPDPNREKLHCGVCREWWSGTYIDGYNAGIEACKGTINNLYAETNRWSEALKAEKALREQIERRGNGQSPAKVPLIGFENVANLSAVAEIAQYRAYIDQIRTALGVPESESLIPSDIAAIKKERDALKAAGDHLSKELKYWQDCASSWRRIFDRFSHLATESILIVNQHRCPAGHVFSVPDGDGKCPTCGKLTVYELTAKKAVTTNN